MDNLENLFELNGPEEYLGEMATIISDRKIGIRIQVNPDPNRKGVPYFKAFNNSKPKERETSVARLHFLDNGIEHHKDGFLDWKITNSDIKLIKSVLESNPKNSDRTVWDVAKWKWNLEYRFFDDDDEDDYFDGKFDDQYKDHPSYVPSTTKIPETWKE